MKNLKCKIAAKSIAAALTIILLMISLGGLLGVLTLYESGAYRSNSIDSFYDSGICRSYLWVDLAPLAYDFLNMEEAEMKADEKEYQYYKHIFNTKFFEGSPNVLFEIVNRKNNQLVFSNFSTLAEGETAIPGRVSRMLESYSDPEKSYSDPEKYYEFTVYLRSPLSEGEYDHYVAFYEVYQKLFQFRNALVWISAVSFLASLPCLLFLFCAAGHRKDREGIVFNIIDRIPLDFYLAFVTIFSGVMIWGTFTLLEYILVMPWVIPVAMIGCVLLIVPVLSLLLTFATRIKAGKWWKNTVCCYILSFFCHGIKYILNAIVTVLHNLPILFKALVGLGILTFIEIVLIAFSVSDQSGAGILLWFILRLAIIVGIGTILLQLRSLKTGGRQLAAGNLDYKINTDRMVWEFKAHGEDLNQIGAGMSKAVDARMKSERMKTELITNVSHDIKTPLTSIINYVDLLMKEKLDNRTAVEYLEVLDRQSAKLKKLTEDLVEASKAAAGNLSVNPADTDIIELLGQSVGEYEERFRECNLEPVLNIPEDVVTLFVDGRLLWRVFDNLLNNVCKYALPNTRVYMNLCDRKQELLISFKNISKVPLNIESEELMERFVRGDSSRTTEGSGLGLSIAKSLIELQGGIFDLTIDGDLFKAVIRFPRKE